MSCYYCGGQARGCVECNKPAVCDSRDSNGVRCELPFGHEGKHVCPKALANWTKPLLMPATKAPCAKASNGLVCLLPADHEAPCNFTGKLGRNMPPVMPPAGRGSSRSRPKVTATPSSDHYSYQLLDQQVYDMDSNIELEATYDQGVLLVIYAHDYYHTPPKTLCWRVDFGGCPTAEKIVEACRKWR